jgi:hypothetical protein
MKYKYVFPKINKLEISKHIKCFSYVFNLIERFVTNEFELDNKCLNQLLLFQKNYVINYDDISKFPYVVELDYDFLGYILDDTELETSVKYNFEFHESKDISLDRFLENIYFGRKRNFGKTLITKEPT